MSKKIIQAIYLRQDLANQSLLVNAISQLIVKLLYTKEKPITFNQICKGLKSVLESNIDSQRVELCLNELQKSGQINKNGDKYVLRRKYRLQLVIKFEQRKMRFESAMDRFFNGTEIDNVKLRSWFEDINILFFCEYSAEWIEDLTGRTEKRKEFVSVFRALHNREVFKINNIPNDESAWLIEQYISFLRSNNPNDHLLMWDYANSMFTSQLITSNLYADKSIKDLFQDSTIVLDTNILMYLDLEKDEYSESYKTIEEIFLKLNIMPVYFRITKEEYRNAILRKIDNIKAILYKYDLPILEESADPFLKTALGRECTTDEHFKVFYDEISKIPEYFSQQLRVDERDDKELSDAIERSKANFKLRKAINDVYLRRNIKDKNEITLLHDVGLIAGAKHLRKNEKVWVLSRDGTVNTYSVENTKAGENPIAISLGTIVNLLSVNDGGIQMEPDNIAPLFSSFIKNDIVPETDIYQLEDLTRMYEIQAQIAELPQEDIIRLAKEINHDRLTGVDDRKIALKIQRRIQSHKIEIKDELSAVKQSLINTKDKADKITDEQRRRKRNYSKNRRRELLREYSREKRLRILGYSIFQVLLLLGVSTGLVMIVANNIEQLNTFWTIVVAFLVNLISDVLCIKKLFQPIFDVQYKKRVTQIEEKIEGEWEDLLKD